MIRSILIATLSGILAGALTAYILSAPHRQASGGEGGHRKRGAGPRRSVADLLVDGIVG